MPNRKNVRRVQKAKKFKPRRRKPPTSTPLGSLVAKGIRTLSGFLPGQSIVRPVVNYFMKTLGFAKFYLTPEGVMADAKFSGASACIPISASDLFCEMRSSGCSAVVEVACVNHPEKKVRAQTTQINYRGIMIDSVNFRLCPTGPLGEREGMWAMVFQANVSLDTTGFSESSFTSHPPSFESVRQMPGSRYGPASRCLSVKWSPSIRKDGEAALGYDFYDTQHNIAGWLIFAYDNYNRANADSDFSAAQIGHEVLINSTGRLREREMSSFASTGYVTILPTVYDATKLKHIYHLTDGEHAVNACRCEDGRLRVDEDSPDFSKLLDSLSQME